MSEFLAAEPLLTARLIERLADLDPVPAVLSAADLAGVAEEQQVTPAVHLVYGGHRIAQDTAQGLVVELEQTWHTVVAVRNVRTTRSGQAARADAGVIMDTVFGAFSGWKPGAGMRALRPTNPPRAGYSKGFIYYPLSWMLRLQMRGGA